MSRERVASSLVILAFAAISVIAFAGLPGIGTTAPQFVLKSQDGVDVKLSDFKGRWVVLYFYPKDFTSGCTLEARNFQRDLTSYEKLHAVIVGISVDSTDSHKGFCAKEGLSFRLLADTDHKVAALYGSLGANQGNAIATRNTFIIDPNGKIAEVFEAVKPAAHSEKVLAALARLQRN